MGPSWEQDCEGRGGTSLVEGITLAKRQGVKMVCGPSWGEVLCLTGRQTPFLWVVDSCWASRNSVLGSFPFMAMADLSTAAQSGLLIV